jgi:tryptophanyl-tRNA synthetase
MQDDVDVLVANYHAPTECANLEVLDNFGVKNIKLQKDVFNPELYFKLLQLAKIGDLNRMTQFKSAETSNRTAHLLTYPVLMVHDVAGYDEVMVGEDQEQHLQYARKLLNKYNSLYEPYTIPSANIVVGRIKDLREPSKKMSKSAPQGCLFLDDSPDEIHLKLRKATAMDKGMDNLKFLYREFVGGKVPESNEQLKTRLAEAIIEKISTKYHYGG